MERDECGNDMRIGAARDLHCDTIDLQLDCAGLGSPSAMWAPGRGNRIP